MWAKAGQQEGSRDGAEEQAPHGSQSSLHKEKKNKKAPASKACLPGASFSVLKHGEF